jgi:hypothetical protein
VNLLLFTIEFERSAGVDGSRNARPDAVEGRGPGRLRWIGLVILAALFVIAAGCSGWLLAGGDPTGLELSGWLAFVPPVVAAEGDDGARLEVMSMPAGATIMLDGPQRGLNPARAFGSARRRERCACTDRDCGRAERDSTSAPGPSIPLAQRLRPAPAGRRDSRQYCPVVGAVRDRREQRAGGEHRKRDSAKLEHVEWGAPGADRHRAESGVRHCGVAFVAADADATGLA